MDNFPYRLKPCFYALISHPLQRLFTSLSRIELDGIHNFRQEYRIGATASSTVCNVVACSDQDQRTPTTL